MHLWKIINTFYKNHQNKPMATFSLTDSAPSMTKPLISLGKKRKQECFTNSIDKQAKNWFGLYQSRERNEILNNLAFFALHSLFSALLHIILYSISFGNFYAFCFSIYYLFRFRFSSSVFSPDLRGFSLINP